MKARLVLLGLLVAAVAGGNSDCAERYPSIWYPHVQRPVASLSGAEGIYFNPAALRAEQRPELGYYHSFNDSTFNGDNGILFSRAGFGLGYYSLRLDGRSPVNSWTLAGATVFSRSLLFGAGYTFYKTDREGYHNDHFWKVGVLYRPGRHYSVGAVVDNLNKMEFASRSTERVYTIGLGIRPFRERITISGDYRFYDGEPFRDGLFTGFLEVELSDGLWLNGHMDETREFGVGLSFAFGGSITEGYGRFDHDCRFSKGIVSHKYSYGRMGYALFEPDRYVALRLSGSYPEERRRSFLFSEPSPAFADLVLGLDDISRDDHIAGLAIRLENPALGWAQLEELREKLDGLKRAGKTVVVFLGPLSGTGSYYLASVADKIAMQRVDALSVVGLLAEVTFYKGLLDKIGIEAELEHTGEYKTASDLLTRDDMSSHHAEAVNALLDDFWHEITWRISSSRGFSIDSAAKIVDNSPLTSVQSLEAGLVDTLIYPDMFDEWAASQLGAKRSVAFEKYIGTECVGTRWGQPPKIAVIPAEGNIVFGKSSTSIFTGEVLGSSTLNRAVRQAREDESVKAVVLRVNSPGGEVLGSESIWRELKLTQKKKPVVVSMSNVAASGGYHISSASDWIVAHNMTVTGSIGVIYGKLNVSGLREKLGFSTYLIKRGENADFYAASSGYTEEQRKKVRSEIELLYDDFVRTVAENRNSTVERIDEVARGRSWSGSRALTHNLVDQIGGLSDAVDAACRMARLDRDDAVVDVVPTRSFALLPSSYPFESVTEFVRFVSNIGLPGMSTEPACGVGEGWFYRSPYEIHIR